jgi:DNA-binding GntR family transcriptional regulator
MFVREITVEQVAEVYVLREFLEGMALSKSFERLKEKDFLKAQKLLERSERKEVYSFIGSSNRAFHEVFYSAGGPTLTIELIGRCFGGITPSWMRFIRERPDSAAAYEKESSQHHWDLLRACRAGALDDATSVLSAHLRHASMVLTEFMTDTQCNMSSRK